MTWLARLIRRRKMERQLDSELRFHLEPHTADLIARGLDATEAQRQARLALGGLEQVREGCRAAEPGYVVGRQVSPDWCTTAARIIRLVLVESLAVIAIAVGLGTVAALTAGRVLDRLVDGVSTIEFPTLILAIAVLVAAE